VSFVLDTDCPMDSQWPNRLPWGDQANPVSYIKRKDWICLPIYLRWSIPTLRHRLLGY